MTSVPISVSDVPIPLGFKLRVYSTGYNIVLVVYENWEGRSGLVYASRVYRRYIPTTRSYLVPKAIDGLRDRFPNLVIAVNYSARKYA